MSRLGLLGRNSDFARLWLGESVSAIGSQITLLALPLLAAGDLGAGAWEMGLLGAAQTAPFMFFALFAGVWVDQRRKLPVLVAANFARATLLGLLAVLAALGILTIGQLLAIAFALGACSVAFEVTYQSYLPRLVEPEHLVEANSGLTASTSVAEVGGPGLGGLLVGAFTAPVALAADAMSFLAAAASLRSIRRAEPDVDPDPPERGLWEQIREGVHETFHNPYLLAFAGEAATYNVAWSAMNAILVLWALRELGLDAGTLGLLLSVGSVGALLGALGTGAVARRIGVGRAMWSSAALSNLGVLCIPIAGGGATATIGLLGTAFFLQGLGSTATNVHTYAIRQAVTPGRLMGRTTAVYRPSPTASSRWGAAGGPPGRDARPTPGNGDRRAGALPLLAVALPLTRENTEQAHGAAGCAARRPYPEVGGIGPQPRTSSPKRAQALPAKKGLIMKRLTTAIAGLLVALAVLVSSGVFAGSAATADSTQAGGHGYAYGFERFLQRYEAANTAFVNGDPSPWSKLTAEKDPASIFGGFGGLGDAGVDEVTARYQLAAGAFRPSGAEVDFEYLVKDVRGRLAYTVALERANVLYTGQTAPQEQFLRATMIFRYDRGDWRIVHRHADTMVDLQLPTPQ